MGFVLDGLPPLALLFLHVGAVLGCAGEADVVGDHDRSRMQPAPVEEPLQVVEVDVLPVVEEYEIQTALGESVVLGENLERRPVADGAVNAGDAIGEAGVCPHAAGHRGVGTGLFDREYVGTRCRSGDPQPAVSAVGTEFHGKLRVRALDGGVEQLALFVADVHEYRLVVGEVVDGVDRGVDIARGCVGNDVLGRRLFPPVTHLTRPYDGLSAESPAQERVPQEWKLLSQRPTQTHCSETSSPAIDFAIRSVLSYVYLTTLRCAPRSIAPSSVATAASTTSPWRRYFGFLAWVEKKVFHFSWSGSSDPMIWTGFGGGLI